MRNLALVLAPLALAVPVPAQITSGAHRAAGAEPMRLRFAVVGDYGVDGPNEAAVAALVAGWSPDLVITTGDNNYPDGAQATIDANIGQHYYAFIHPYVGGYGPGAPVNRFFPSLGNHDWVTPGATPYLAYFTLPGNERYYDFVRGPVHFYAVDSDVNEPDGITASSVQATWLRTRLAASSSPFDFVYFHHPAYSSGGGHGSTVEMQWPFRAWGAEAVFAGHEHSYERILRDGFPYIVCGIGGASLYSFSSPILGSTALLDSEYGAMLVEVDEELATMRAITRAGAIVDTFALPARGVNLAETSLVASGSAWKYRDDGSNQGTAWRAPGFVDSGWAAGPAQLGYGDGDEATVVSFGPDPANKHATTYFRRSFPVASPAVFRTLGLELVRDDGAIAYLNGVEVFRSNMPAGAVGHLDFASSNLSAPDEGAYSGVDVAPGLLVAGTNVLAVEIHQSSATSSDLSFDLRLTGILEGTKLSAKGATWKYRDTGVAPGAAWVQPGYDDSLWLSGPAQLGYGDGGEATVVGFGPDPSNKHITTWFRRSFTVASPGAYSALLLKILRDDGVAVHLNGTEIYRANLPWPGLSASSTAPFVVGGAEESEFFETYVAWRALVAGTNVLAVEIHQSSGSSSDISFDLELVGL